MKFNMIRMKFEQKFFKTNEFEVCFLRAKFVSGRGSAPDAAETTLPQTLYSRCPPPHSIILRRLPNRPYPHQQFLDPPLVTRTVQPSVIAIQLVRHLRDVLPVTFNCRPFHDPIVSGMGKATSNRSQNNDHSNSLFLALLRRTT